MVWDKTIKKLEKLFMSKNKKRLVVLDTHAILHRAYHALPDFTSAKGVPTGALFGVVSMILSIAKELKPDYIVAAYDLPKPTHRHLAFEGYKSQRKKTDGDLVSQIIKSREVLSALSIPIYEREGFEADDIIGTVVEKNSDNKNLEIIIASGDMDTLQLVKKDQVMVYTLKKGIKDTILYDEETVKARFCFEPKLLVDYKGLRGDPSDNIPGVAGIGEKTATTLISHFGTIENIYKKLKKNPEEVRAVGITERVINILLENEEEAEFSKMLATIRRDATIDFKMPEKEWKGSVDLNAIEKLFLELDFRSLLTRAKEFFKGNIGSESDLSGEKKEMVGEEMSEEELEEAKIALWILDSNKTNPSLEDVLNFGGREKVLEEVKKQKLDFVLENIEKPLIGVVKEMKKNGIKLDSKYLKNLSEELHTQLNSVEKIVWEMAGGEFNIASPKQLSEILFVKMDLKVKGMKKTSTGAQSTQEKVLRKMIDLHPIIEKILEHRELSKLLSTYIDNMPEMVGEDGRLHADFSQTGTTTGRMSSSNPNMQNIPIKSEMGRKIRHAFVADKGKELLSIDYSQIELRIAAFLSGDENLINIFKDGLDIHTAVASRVFKVDLEKVDKEMRRKAKIINFGILYGMGVNALKDNLGGTREEAQEFYNQYFSAYPTLASYLEMTKSSAKAKGYTETFFGRRRYFPGIKSPLPFIRAEAERMAINAPIQGTQADLIKLAMVEIYKNLKEKKLLEDVKIVLQIHDEVIFEVVSEKVEETARQIRKIMENILIPEKIAGVPIKTSAYRGKNWGEMKEI